MQTKILLQCGPGTRILGYIHLDISQQTRIYPGRYILVDQDLSTQIYPSRLGYIHVDISQQTRINPPRQPSRLGYIQVDKSQSTRIYPRGYILVTRIYPPRYILVYQDISTWIYPSRLGYIHLDLLPGPHYYHQSKVEIIFQYYHQSKAE